MTSSWTLHSFWYVNRLVRASTRKVITLCTIEMVVELKAESENLILHATLPNIGVTA